MAAGSDSQGLKIAVAAFVTLTVVLAVATYFAYSSYSEASAKLVAQQAEASKWQTEAGNRVRNFDALKERAGYKTVEDFDGLQAQIKKDSEALAAELTRISTQLKELVGQYQNAGGSQAKIAELQLAADQAINAVTSLPEPNRTFAETQARIVQLLDNLTQLSTQLALDNEHLQTTLKSTDQVNQQQLGVQTEEVRKSKDDLAKEHDRHENERQDLLRKYDELQNLTAQQATEIAGLKQQLAQMKDTTDRQRATLMAQLREWRARVEQNEDVMDTPDGVVQFVDYDRGEVRTNVGRVQGARERMQLSVFDRNSAGLPTEKPKALIELIQVGDRTSVGRIVRTNSPSDPIRNQDYLYSAAWSPNRPERFALIGKIDVDRDGSDDRANLKRMIAAAGGVIDYDLPPPGTGQETGQITPSTSWYVVDDRQPIRPTGAAANDGMEDGEYLKKRSQIIEEARLNGIRPISIERLLAYLGYRYGEVEPGRSEAINRDAVRSLLNPRGRPAAPATATPPAETPAPTP